MMDRRRVWIAESEQDSVQPQSTIFLGVASCSLLVLESLFSSRVSRRRLFGLFGDRSLGIADLLLHHLGTLQRQWSQFARAELRDEDSRRTIDIDAVAPT